MPKTKALIHSEVNIYFETTDFTLDEISHIAGSLFENLDKVIRLGFPGCTISGDWTIDER